MAPGNDVRLRVFLLALEPAIILARALSLSLDDVTGAVEAVYVQHYRDRAFSLEQIARRVQKSRRTIATLTKRAATVSDALHKSRTITIRRELVRLVGKTGTMKLAALREATPAAKRADVDHAIELLVEDGTFALEGSSARLLRDWVDFLGPEEDKRLDSVRHICHTLASTLMQRFFERPADEDAFARVLTFSSSRASLRDARAQAYAKLFEMATRLDAEATAGTQGDTAQFSFAFYVARVAEKQ